LASISEELPARPTAVRYAVLAGLCLLASSCYIQRNSLGVVEKQIREQLEFTKMQSAWLTGGLYLTYALLQVPGGRLGQIWGSRITLPIYSTICSGATVLFAVSAGFPGLLASRMGTGLGQAGVFPCTTDIVKTWIPISRQGLANGSITASMQFGAILGTQLTGLMASSLGWRLTLGLFSLPGFLWAAWFYIWYRNRPTEHASVNESERQLLSAAPADILVLPGSAAPRSVPWTTILTSRTLAWICAQQFFRAAGYMFYGSWFATFLQEGRGVKMIADAALMTSAPLAATALGSMAGGWLSDRLLVLTGSRRLSRQGLSAASQLACAGFILLAYRITDPWTAVGIISVGAFCAAIAGPVAYTVTIDLGGRHVPTIFGMMNMWGNLGALGFPFGVAWLVGEGPNANWNPVLFLFAGIYIAATFCWLAFDIERPIIDDNEK
jgi:MFS family permease